MTKAPSAPSTRTPPKIPSRRWRFGLPLGGADSDRAAPADYLSLFGDAAILRWGVHLRWTMLGTLLGFALLLTLAGVLPGSLLVPVSLLALPVAGYNLLFLVLLQLAPLWDNPRALRVLRWAQIPPDLLALTVALHLSGGAATPLALGYVFFIVTALVLLPRYGTYYAAGVASLCYTLLVLGEGLALPPAPALLAAADPQTAPGRASYLAYWLTLVGLLWAIAYVADRLSGRIQAGESLVARQLGDLTLLYRFSDNLSLAPDLDAAMAYIVTELGGMLRTDSCSLMLISANGEAEFRAATGIPPEALAAYRQRPLGPGNALLTSVLSGGQGVFAPDVDTIPGLRQALIRTDTRSFYSFPLRAEDKIVGLLNLSFNRYYTMPPSSYDLLAVCARQAGLAIERTILYQEAQRAAREMTSLYRIGLATSSSLEINGVLRQIADQVQAVLPLDSFVLALYDAAADTMDYVIQRDRGTDYPREILSSAEGGASGWIARNQQPLLIRHWDREIANLPFVPNNIGDHIQSYLGVPLVANDRVVGVLSVQKLAPGAYDDDNLRLLSAIAAQAALALENARLHEATRQQARHDSLTGALNHAALLACIDDMVGQAQVLGEPVGLIMLDIDLFKRYNDTYGHVAGDIALSTVVMAIRQNIKVTDAVGRWGGEEFAIVLPGATSLQALGVARRIRATLATLPMPDSDGLRLPVPTISQGVACYPQDSASNAQLIDHADSALYQAKARGRDAIVTWADLSAPGAKRA
ncbi:MAG TPA: diguanylate cyclase [Chloroflexia bacterium]|nr:diguanylate cyclase [Chloroflexia bacterium]